MINPMNSSVSSEKFITEPLERSLKESILSQFQNQKESVMNKLPFSQIFIFEFFAMFIFTFSFICFDSILEEDAQAAGAMLIAACIAGTLCGANLNPTVTLSNCLKKENKYRFRMLGFYLPAQFLSSFLALILADFLNDAILDRLVIQDAAQLFRVMLTEAMGAFVLVFSLLQISNPNTTYIDTEVAGFTSIAVFYQIGRSYAPVAGLCINPAITLSLAIQYATKGDLEPITWCWVWLLGDLLGGGIATLFYDQMFQPTIRHLREQRRKFENDDDYRGDLS